MSAKNKYINKRWYKKRMKKPGSKIVPSQKSAESNNHMLHGYHGFKLYIKTGQPTDEELALKRINYLEKYFNKHPDKYNVEIISKNKSFTVDLLHMYADEDFNSRWIDFKTILSKDAENVLALMAVAVHQLVVLSNKDFDARVYPRIINYEPILHLKNLRTNCFGSLISVCGTVIKASNTRQLLIKEILFQCENCTGHQLVQQLDNIFTVPKNCPTKGCKAQSKFHPVFNSKTRAVNWQSLKMQELIGVDQYENGRVPRTVDCEVTDDLVGICVPGDDVTITGVIKSRSCFKKNQPSVFSMYVDVVTIVNNKNQANGSIERITFNTEDYYAIQKIHDKQFLFRFLVQSLCPNIYGNEIVKAGLLLTLFGGTYCEDDVASRSISHVLMVGDPGLGKSQMLLACANVAPRGVYVCGNTSTSSGLTVTMTKESNGDYSLEAGALILADRGCCCIDEFDKMTQHNSLLEAMEQQTVSIAKAGVMCNLSARASIFAAGNPIGGHYDKAKTVAENLKISSPLISRFDLVFVLVDRPSQEYDRLVSERVLSLHRQTKKARSREETLMVRDCLEDRLKLSGNEDVELLDHPRLRKYIAYAHKYVHPVIVPEAQEILERFYLELRKHCEANNCSPITARQLESMIRLTQARAKTELREEATVEDAIDVLEIMRNSFIDIFTDETGTLDFRRSQSGSGMSKQKQLKAFLSLLESQAEELAQSVFTRNQLKEYAEEVGISNDRFSDVLQKLNFHGYLLKRAVNKYKFTSVDF